MDTVLALQSREIANTILKQIKGLDFWALGAWGANQYVSLGKGEFSGKPYIGGVQFKVRTPKYRSGVRVLIYYTADDLYSLRVVRCIGTNLTEIKFLEGIYCDMLVECIDRIIESGRE